MTTSENTPTPVPPAPEWAVKAALAVSFEIAAASDRDHGGAASFTLNLEQVAAIIASHTPIPPPQSKSEEEMGKLRLQLCDAAFACGHGHNVGVHDNDDVVLLSTATSYFDLAVSTSGALGTQAVGVEESLRKELAWGLQERSRLERSGKELRGQIESLKNCHANELAQLRAAASEAGESEVELVRGWLYTTLKKEGCLTTLGDILDELVEATDSAENFRSAAGLIAVPPSPVAVAPDADEVACEKLCARYDGNEEQALIREGFRAAMAHRDGKGRDAK